MCTLIAIHRSVPGADLVVAANRDEFFGRPTAGLSLVEGSGGRILAPRDLRAGGTWLGLNREGVFVGLTNRSTANPDPRRRSRGLLVLEALGAASAEQAMEDLGELDAGAWNPFNLFVADTEHAFSLSCHDEKLHVRELGPGAHVIGNLDPDDRDHPKTKRILEQVESVATLPADRVLDALGRICQEHGDGTDPLGDTCIHLDGYGTRSSLLLQSGAANERMERNGSAFTGTGCRMLYADGFPCESPYRDFTPLLHELSHSASYEEEEHQARKAS